MIPPLLTPALRAIAKAALLLGGLLGAWWALRHLGLDDESMAAAQRHGPAAFVAVAALACTVGVPRQVVAYGGGLAFGFWPGCALALVAEVLACAANFLWARLVARRWAAAWLARRGGGRMERLDRFLHANTFTATLTLRLLPVGSNLALNLLAGVSGVALAPFLAASALGYIPQTAVFALVGGGLRVSDGAKVALGIALFAVSAGLGLYLLRRRPSEA